MSLNSKLSATDIAIEKMSKNTQKEIIKEFSRALNETRSSLAMYYEKYSKDGTLTYSGMAKYNRLKALNDEVSNKLASVYKANGKDTKELLKSVYNESYLGTSYAIESETSVNSKFVMVNMGTINSAIENPISGLTLSERLEKHRSDIIINVKSEITQGLIRGEGYGKIAKRIKGRFDGDASKAIRVAQTETHRILNQSRLDAGIRADELGINMLKVWDATLDAKTRNSHQSLDGVKIGVKENFTSSIGGYGLAPGSLGLAADDINCRCAIRYEVDGLSPKLRATRDAQGKTVLVPNTTYAEWKSLKGVTNKENTINKMSDLTETETEAIKGYKNFGNAINQSIRKRAGFNVDESAAVYVPRLENILKKTELAKETQVYRGMSSKALGQYSNIVKQDPTRLIGAEISDKAFMSTSKNIDVASHNFMENGKRLRGDDVLLEIKVPKGYHGLELGEYSLNNEDEILLINNSRIRITSVEDTRKVATDKMKQVDDLTKPIGEESIFGQDYEQKLVPTGEKQMKGYIKLIGEVFYE